MGIWFGPLKTKGYLSASLKTKGYFICTFENKGVFDIHL